MAHTRPIKKKLKGYQPYGDPLPVPVASLTGFPSSASSWNYYHGIFETGVVIVTDPNQIASLWHNGYFGQLKNSNLLGEGCKNENFQKYKKRWKLLESDCLKDVAFFKKFDKADGASSAVELSECNVIDIDDSNESTQEKTFSNNFESNQTEDSCIQVMAGKDEVGTVEFNSEQSDFNDSSAEIDTDCKTVLTFESYQNATYFFDHSNENDCSGYLELSLQEAMFLSYVLGCLIVKRKVHGKGKKSRQHVNEETLSIDQMWREFVSEDPKFVVRYFVYHHYRTKGWVVKNGLKFGADYVLYPVGPPFYHAQYTVMIQCIWADNHERDDFLSNREMSWINIAAMERLTCHVNKTPLMCFVLRPRSLSSSRLCNILCLRSLTIEEVTLSRWDPNVVNKESDAIIIIE